MDYDFVSSEELPPPNEHPMYAEGLTQIADGQWQRAFELFRLLRDIYPDDIELKDLLDQVQMRATLFQVQPKSSSRTKKRLSGRRLMIEALIVIIVIIAAYVAYELWISPVMVHELRLRQITNLREEADTAMAVGDYAGARQSLQRLQALLPEDSQTIGALHTVQKLEASSALYDEARSLMEIGNWDRSIEVLTELQSLDAEYRDLPQLLQVAQESQAMDQQFHTAEEAFARGDWGSAIAQYEALQHASLTFRFEEIQARLFESHLKYGQALVEAAGVDSDPVYEAITHFSEALKIRPMDSDALRERHLAETFLAALNARNQEEVIDLLQLIYDQQPGYAGSQMAGLLYAALLERGDSRLNSGDEAAAAADYRLAAGLAVEDPSDAQEKLAELAAETSP